MQASNPSALPAESLHSPIESPPGTQNPGTPRFNWRFLEYESLPDASAERALVREKTARFKAELSQELSPDAALRSSSLLFSTTHSSWSQPACLLVVAVASSSPSPPSAAWHLPLGVDLEDHRRAVSQPIYQRITAPEERELGASPLEMWVLKEAAFKANRDNPGTVMKHYALHTWDRALKQGTLVLKTPRKTGWQSFDVQLVAHPRWLIALAITASTKKPEDLLHPQPTKLLERAAASLRGLWVQPSHGGASLERHQQADGREGSWSNVELPSLERRTAD